VVCAARKKAGLNESFPHGDPLPEFAAFLRVCGAAAKDIANNVIHSI